MYSRILLAYDGSVEGRTALREGALLAKHCGAEVFLLSVIAENTGTRVAQAVDVNVFTEPQENYKVVFNDGIARLRSLGFEPVAKLVVGEPAEEIGRFAKQIAAELVVVGYRRQGVIARWWSGPTGAYLVDHIHCSLLVSRNEISDEAFRMRLMNSGQSTV